MTLLGLVRHGSTEWNRLGKLQGQLDTELTDEGRNQAQLLGVRLKKKEWDFIISSDLSRAKETAEILSDCTGIPLLALDERLRERGFGQLEGTTLEERLDRWGPEWKKLNLGGESDEQVWRRWVDFSKEFLSKYPNSQMIIVSHGGFLGQVLKGLDLERPDDLLTNTSLTWIQRKESSDWQCMLYNCTAHLNVKVEK